LLPARTSVSSSSSSNPYAAVLDSKLELADGSAFLPSSSSITGGGTVLQRLGSASLVVGLSDIKQLASGTTPNNSAAGGSGAAVPVTRWVEYLTAESNDIHYLLTLNIRSSCCAADG
jgi:hypothetical protein